MVEFLMAQARDSKLHSVERMVAYVLLVGVSLSVLFLLVGYAFGLDAAFSDWLDPLAWERYMGLAAHFPKGFGEIVRGLRDGDGGAVMVLGLAVLIVTPLLRVFSSWVVFVLQKDWVYAGLTAIVIVLLGISLVLGVTH
jgi:uncharacterized membrane protein